MAKRKRRSRVEAKRRQDLVLLVIAHGRQAGELSQKSRLASPQLIRDRAAPIRTQSMECRSESLLGLRFQPFQFGGDGGEISRRTPTTSYSATLGMRPS